MKEKNRKIINIIEIILGALIIGMLIGTLVLQLVVPESEISIWVKDNIWNVNASIEGLKAQLPEIIQCIIYIFLILSVSKILRMIFKVQINKSDRAKTVITLFDGLVKYGCAIAVIILILKAWGVDTAALVASVGVLTLIVG